MSPAKYIGDYIQSSPKIGNVSVNQYGLLFIPLLDDKILDWSKLKQIPDDILKYIQNEKQVLYKVENIVRKEKLLVSSNFSFSHNVFHSYISLVHQNAALSGNGLIHV